VRTRYPDLPPPTRRDDSGTRRTAQTRALTEAPLLAPLPPEERLRAAEAAEWRSLRRGQAFFRDGEEARSVPIVVSGRLQCCRGCDGTREWISAVVTAPGAVGLSEVVARVPREGCAVALEPTTVAALPASLVRDLMSRHAGFASQVAGLLADDVLRAQRMCGAVAMRTPLARLCRHLLDAAGSGDAGVLAETQGRIASQIGTVREVLGRSLRRLERDGVISRHGREFRILRREELERLAG
jgi:CRP/FNR family transcriptional regulator